jgi:ketosteroid isomerase-like protein
MQELTERFVAALHRLHTDRDVDALVELFHDEATLTKLGQLHEAHGPDGARQFWDDYRAVFDDIEATFTHTVADDTSVALEWTSSGSLRGGHPFSYDGVSVLDSASGDLIDGFRTYYDSAAFVRQPLG